MLPNNSSSSVPSSEPFSCLENGNTNKRKRRPAGTPDPDAEVVSLSPKTLLESDRYVCEICNQGFQRLEPSSSQMEYGLEGSVEFKWKSLEDGKQEACVANSWFEVVSVVHLMAVHTLSEADILMIPHDHSGSGIRTVSSELLSTCCLRHQAIGILCPGCADSHTA